MLATRCVCARWVSYFNCRRFVISGSKKCNWRCRVRLRMWHDELFLLPSTHSGPKQEYQWKCQSGYDGNWWWHQNTTLQLVEWHILLSFPPRIFLPKTMLLLLLLKPVRINEFMTSQLEWFILYKWNVSVFRCSKGKTQMWYTLLTAGLRRDLDCSRAAARFESSFAPLRTVHQQSPSPSNAGMWKRKWTSNLLPPHDDVQQSPRFFFAFVCADETQNWFSSRQFMQFDETTSALAFSFPYALYRFRQCGFNDDVVARERNRSQQWRHFKKGHDGKLLPKLFLLFLWMVEGLGTILMNRDMHYFRKLQKYLMHVNVPRNFTYKYEFTEEKFTSQMQQLPKASS